MRKLVLTLMMFLGTMILPTSMHAQEDTLRPGEVHTDTVRLPEVHFPDSLIAARDSAVGVYIFPADSTSAYGIILQKDGRFLFLALSINIRPWIVNYGIWHLTNRTEHLITLYLFKNHQVSQMYYSEDSTGKYLQDGRIRFEYDLEMSIRNPETSP
jgi:hypothetical protein